MEKAVAEGVAACLVKPLRRAHLLEVVLKPGFRGQEILFPMPEAVEAGLEGVLDDLAVQSSSNSIPSTIARRASGELWFFGNQFPDCEKFRIEAISVAQRAKQLAFSASRAFKEYYFAMRKNEQFLQQDYYQADLKEVLGKNYKLVGRKLTGCHQLFSTLFQKVVTWMFKNSNHSCWIWCKSTNQREFFDKTEQKAWC